MTVFSGTRHWVYPHVGGWPVPAAPPRGPSWPCIWSCSCRPGCPVGGHPALRLDLPDRRLYAFGAIFTASDTMLLLLLLLFLAFCALLLHLALRPALVRLRLPADGLPRGLDPPHRGLDRGRPGRAAAGGRGPAGRCDRVWRKAAKWTLFAVVSVVAAMAFMSFFAGARELLDRTGGPDRLRPGGHLRGGAGSSTLPGSASSSATTSAPTPGSRAR